MKPASPVIPNPWSSRNMPNRYGEVIYAKSQPQYNPLPSIKQPDGVVLTRWAMSWRERCRALWTGSVYLEVMTFNQPLQPLKMSVQVPEIEPRIGNLSLRQKVFSRTCKLLAGDEHEERATNLLPDDQRIRGLRLWLYWKVRRLRFREGDRLAAKYGTHAFLA